MDSSMFFGNLIPALMRPPLAMKHFVPVPLDPASAVRLLPPFNAMDPVQKAVLNHTLGLAPAAKRKHVSCGVCQLRFNSQSQALAHYKGTKHAKKLKALDTPKCKLQCSPAVAKETTGQDLAGSVNTTQVPDGADRKDVGCGSSPLSPALRPATATPTPATPTPLLNVHHVALVAETSSAIRGEEPSPLPEIYLSPEPEPEPEPETETETETEDAKARRLLYCSLCKVAVNSASQLEAHNTGTKHKTMLEARSGVGCIKSFPRAGVKSKLAPSCKPSVTGLQNKTFHCETCDVHVNSETQLKQHISSRRHKDRAAGKPAKPKYSPYSKAQKGASKQPVKLLLMKDPPSLTSQILPAHLAAVAAAAIGRSFSHRTNNSQSPALFQTQTLPPALLHHAPGPIRTSHPPVLFAPY